MLPLVFRESRDGGSVAAMQCEKHFGAAS